MCAEFVWGVDPALSKVAFAFAALVGEAVTVETAVTRTDAREGERLGLLDRQVRWQARALACCYPPSCVWLEQPSGRFRNLQLAYAVGVIAAALYESLGGVPVFMVAPAAWKVRTVGAGNASKAQVAAWVERLGVDVASQDEADAAAIAVAGRAMVRAGSWEAVA
jgi:Holliday junction resolvasome RuvABC endonuclease subunit